MTSSCVVICQRATIGNRWLPFLLNRLRLLNEVKGAERSTIRGVTRLKPRMLVHALCLERESTTKNIASQVQGNPSFPAIVAYHNRRTCTCSQLSINVCSAIYAGLQIDTSSGDRLARWRHPNRSGIDILELTFIRKSSPKDHANLSYYC